MEMRDRSVTFPNATVVSWFLVGFEVVESIVSIDRLPSDVVRELIFKFVSSRVDSIVYLRFGNLDLFSIILPIEWVLLKEIVAAFSLGEQVSNLLENSVELNFVDASPGVCFQYIVEVFFILFLLPVWLNSTCADFFSKLVLKRLGFFDGSRLTSLDLLLGGRSVHDLLVFFLSFVWTLWVVDEAWLFLSHWCLLWLSV